MLELPGEPFSAIGMKIKESGERGLILPCALTNGYEGYFPTDRAYDEGGYEAATSPYKKGVGTDIVRCAQKLLEELK